MPETGIHLELRTALYLLVRDFVGDRGAVGSDQFVYWDASDPACCLAPDLIVRLGAAPGPFPSWKVWERGAPHLGVEIVSAHDRAATELASRLERYRRAGFDEVVIFDPEASETPLRVWDRVEGDLVERALEGEGALACDALGLYWCVRPDARLHSMLRLAHDARAQSLLPLPSERIAALEAELRRRTEG